MSTTTVQHEKLEMAIVNSKDGLPDWLKKDFLAEFLHHNMKPYHDSIPDIHKALDYCLSPEKGKGGFIVLVRHEEQLSGVLVVLDTGMSGYIPAHIVLFVSVLPDMRGHGIGGKMLDAALERCTGDVKLHVEYDNPAKRLYERSGFKSKYAEMRYSK